MKKIIYLILIFVAYQISFSQMYNLRTIKTEADYFPRLVSAVQIYDNNDEPIIGLKKSNFSVTIDGKKCDSLNAITYKESGLGFNIMLCLDISGTMKGAPLDTVKKAILKFIDEMRTVDKLAILGFADNPELISDFSSDKEYLREKVNEIKSKGTQTAFYYAGYKGLKKLIDIKDKTAKILIIMGDGKNESKASSYTEDDIITLAKQEGIPAFNIGYTKIDKSYLQSLERISDKTNGKFYESPNDEELDKQYSKLYRQLLNIYLLSYQICGIAGDGNEHLNSISVFNNSIIQKNVTNKFVAPAGAQAIKCETATIIIKEKETSVWYYIIPLIIFLIAIIMFIIWFIRKKKKNKIESNVENNTSQDYLKYDDPNEVIVPNIQSYNDNYSSDSNRDTTIILTHKPLNESSILIMELRKGEYSGQSFELNKNGASIGRNKDNQISFPDSPTVSSVHAKILYNNGNFTIEDSNSTNGTYVNGKKIIVHQINDGDIFKIGSCEGVFNIK